MGLACGTKFPTIIMHREAILEAIHAGVGWVWLVRLGILIPLLAQCVGVYIFVVGPLPTYDYLTSTHAVNAPRPSLFFTALPLPCIILNTN